VYNVELLLTTGWFIKESIILLLFYESKYAILCIKEVVNCGRL